MDNKQILKWEKEYIRDIDLSNIKWIKLNNQELREFYNKNYLDKDLWQFVATKTSCFICPLGMHYLTFDSSESRLDYKYLLGVVDNNISKKTIVASMVYLENYLFFGTEFEPITYMNTVEVNAYFRNLGIFKEMCEEAICFLNLNNNIITSPESEMGILYKTYDIFKKNLIEKGFKKEIWNERLIMQNIYEFYESLKKEQKVFKK